LENEIFVSPEIEPDVKQRVREFYDSVGWKQVGSGLYQNARYEDLRLVSREYIHRCHVRVNRYLKKMGKFLLDAGSGPIQYPEYLEYSSGYQYRVCLDISILALDEARERIGSHGLFVVGDAANLPFKPEAFDGVVSSIISRRGNNGKRSTSSTAYLFRVGGWLWSIAGAIMLSLCVSHAHLSDWLFPYREATVVCDERVKVYQLKERSRAAMAVQIRRKLRAHSHTSMTTIGCDKNCGIFQVCRLLFGEV